MSKWSLPNYAKRFGLQWKRFRRSLRQKRDENQFRRAQQELDELIAEPDLTVMYFDEAGFFSKASCTTYGLTRCDVVSSPKASPV